MNGRAGGRQQLRTVTWLLALVTAIWLLTASGSGTLAAPSGFDVEAVRSWAGARDPLTIVFVILRLTTLAIAWYLAGVTIVGLLARLAGRARLLRAVDLLTVPAARRLVHAALGTGLAVASLTAPAPPARVEPRQVSAQPVSQVDGAAWVLLAAQTPADRERSEVYPIPVPGTADDERMVQVPALMPDTPQRPSAVAHPRQIWRVRSGDHLWSIAEQAVIAATGEAPSDADIAAYWERLISVNRERLPDPANPDLIIPGDVLELPRVPGR